MTIRTSVSLPVVHPFVGIDLRTALAERASYWGDSTFLVWEPPEGERSTWTYSAFAAEVDQVAAGLQARGVRSGDPVVLMLDNCPAFLLCWFACARLGAVAVDLNSRYVTDEIRHALSITGVVGVVTHAGLLPALEPLRDLVSWVVTTDEGAGTCPDLLGDPNELGDRPADPGAALCVQFTSGTTSRPKAVLFTHANALWAAKVGATHAGYTSDDVTLVTAPLFHTAALSWMTLATFWVGGTVVLVPKYSASRFWDVSRRNHCTNAFALGIVLQTLGAKPVPEHDYRFWVFGLEMPALEDHFGVRMFCAWGMTEMVTNVIVNDRTFRSADGAIGRLAPEYQARVTRPDGSDASPGEDGELRVRGVRGLSVFAEYLLDDTATAAAFDDGGYFLTGDLVTVLPGGDVRFAGRGKDMLKVGGENVAAGEIERVLVEVPGVTQAAVVGRPDPILDEVPVAFLTITAGADEQTTRADALAQCRTRLADFKVPREVHVLEEIPTVTMGKIAKGQLGDLARELALS